MQKDKLMNSKKFLTFKFCMHLSSLRLGLNYCRVEIIINIRGYNIHDGEKYALVQTLAVIDGFHSQGAKVDSLLLWQRIFS